MLTKWIVATYKVIVEVALWAFMIIGGLVGAVMGDVVDHGFLGFLIGAAAGFLGMAVFLGSALLLHEIHKHVKAIETPLIGSGLLLHEIHEHVKAIDTHLRSNEG